MNKQYFNKNFLVRYYPDSEDTHTNKLIGYDTFLKLFPRAETRQNMIDKILASKSDKVDVKLRSGFRVTVVAR